MSSKGLQLLPFSWNHNKYGFFLESRREDFHRDLGKGREERKALPMVACTWYYCQRKAGCQAPDRMRGRGWNRTAQNRAGRKPKTKCFTICSWHRLLWWRKILSPQTVPLNSQMEPLLRVLGSLPSPSMLLRSGPLLLTVSNFVIEEDIIYAQDGLMADPRTNR